MKKFVLLVLVCILSCVSTISQQYHFKGNFYVDDFEESSVDLTILATSSNPSVISSNTLSVLGSDNNKQLVFNVNPDSYGDVSINIAVCDNGYSSIHTAMFYASLTNTPTSNTNLSEFPFFLKTISYSNRVELQWSTNAFGTVITNISHPLRFKINRFSTNIIESANQFTIGYITGNNFVDTNVMSGKSYWYTVSIKNVSTNLQTSILCTDLIVPFHLIPSIPIQYTSIGFAFLGTQGKTYRISYKSDLTIDTDWIKMEDITVVDTDMLTFNGPQYQNKIIYVTEVQQ